MPEPPKNTSATSFQSLLLNCFFLSGFLSPARTTLALLKIYMYVVKKDTRDAAHVSSLPDTLKHLHSQNRTEMILVHMQTTWQRQFRYIQIICYLHGFHALGNLRHFLTGKLLTDFSGDGQKCVLASHSFCGGFLLTKFPWSRQREAGAHSLPGYCLVSSSSQVKIAPLSAEQLQTSSARPLLRARSGFGPVRSPPPDRPDTHIVECFFSCVIHRTALEHWDVK